MTINSKALPGRELAEFLRRYPEEVSFGDEDPAVIFDRYHTPDIIWVSDGAPLNRDTLLAHFHSTRKNVTGIDIRVHETLTEGDRVAARYTLTAQLRKGRVAASENFFFGHLHPDGRLQHVEQVTRILPPPPSD
jgi:hypothetical protein